MGRPFQTRLDGAEYLRGWTVQVFPRRGNTVSLRLSIWDRPGHAVTAAQFTVPNPTPGPYPQWAAAPVPITKRDGDLSFALIRLTAGPLWPAWLPPRLLPVPWNCASFRISERGKPAGDWAPVGTTLSDATGNVIIPWGTRHQQLDIVGPDGHFVEPERWCENWYNMEVSPAAKVVDVTFAVVKSRFAEFVAKPSRT